MIGLFPKMTRTALSRLLISQSDSEITGICCLFLISCYFVTLLQKVHYKKGISLGVSKTKNLRPRKLEKSNSKPSTLGLKLVFRQGHVHPTGNEDVRPHVESGYSAKYGGSPSFDFETSCRE